MPRTEEGRMPEPRSSPGPWAMRPEELDLGDGAGEAVCCVWVPREMAVFL